MKYEDWYKNCWTLDIKNQSWVEDTENQVDFIIKALGLSGKERILDMACGFGRHALSFARRGFSVVGVDITKAYIEDAIKTAKEFSLNAAFIQSDVREIRFENEFDVVLNLTDGAIGYLETDDENLKIFDAIAKALKPGGKHFMDICSAEYAKRHFPKRHWYIGEKALTLVELIWDDENRRMSYGGCDLLYGDIAQKPNITLGFPTRLYSIPEIEIIFRQRHMEILKTYSDYKGNQVFDKDLRFIICAQKKEIV